MIDVTQRLRLLLSYLDSDPDNIELMGDAIQAALDADSLDIARDLIETLRMAAPDGEMVLTHEAMLAMRQRQFARAADIYEKLMEMADGAAIRFNRAWSLAMIGDKVRAAQLLESEVVAQLPAAAALRVQLLHEAGEFDEAAEFGKEMLARHPKDSGLSAAMSVLAIDIGDIELASHCAADGGNHPDATATRGMLFMNDALPELAMAEFDAAIATRSHNPRAWIGRGLAKLAQQDVGGAIPDLEMGAAQFGDHIGSWLAVGWANLASGNVQSARARFEQALAIDRNFAESHGSLAVLDVMDGKKDEAQHRVATALRLDRQCFSAALAKSLLLEGDPAQARAIIDRALATPLNASGASIGRYMSALAMPTLH